MKRQDNLLRPEYEAPKVTVLEIISEGCILSASDPKGKISDFDGSEWGTVQPSRGIFD